MSTPTRLRVIVLKPSKYGLDGFVERFRKGFMPNSTVPYLATLVPYTATAIDPEWAVDVLPIDEYVQTDLEYLHLLGARRDGSSRTLLLLVGVQSHQFHRALDLAAFARARGAMVVMGGPHPMTCDTTQFHGSGVSFALAEAELVLAQILRDAADGQLLPVYGRDQRWQAELDAPALVPPPARDLERYVVPMLGVYPARGCPYTCTFCSVIKIAGRAVRSQGIETTLASLRAAKAAGVRLIMFTSDNFNKYPEAPELLQAMVDERISLPFFVQCDMQIAEQHALVELLARAGCFEMFLGVESFHRETLKAARKFQNHPERYGEIVRLCRAYGIVAHFSNIIGFPSDTRETVKEHLEILESLAPEVASFYILSPIPGTEQYDDFLGQGLITEQNLDRFDGSCPTWRHPNLSGRELRDLLFECYRKFYALPGVLKQGARLLTRNADALTYFAVTGNALLCRHQAWKRRHPMSGGLGRVRLDSEGEYLEQRERDYGCRRVPLPASLALSAADREVNRRARVILRRSG
jgi:radical SAM superfamily enzyme YgiQ (UPF0313 family)